MRAGRTIPLDHLAALRVRGADAERFLQGQLSSDVVRLSEARTQLAGLHNPQGRVIAIFRLFWLGPGDILAVLPRELIGDVAQRLKKFVLRAKVTLADESDAWRIQGWIALDPQPGDELPPTEDRPCARVAAMLRAAG